MTSDCSTRMVSREIQGDHSYLATPDPAPIHPGYIATSQLAGEMLLQALPTGLVVGLAFLRLEREFRHLDKVACLKHECHGLAVIIRLQRCGRGLLECLGVRPVRCHAVVQARAAWHEACGLRVVDTVD